MTLSFQYCVFKQTKLTDLGFPGQVLGNIGILTYYLSDNNEMKQV